eukprot:2888947-Rhodomonas_salina.2
MDTELLDGPIMPLQAHAARTRSVVATATGIDSCVLNVKTSIVRLKPLSLAISCCALSTARTTVAST